MFRFFRTIRRKLFSEGKAASYTGYAIGEVVLIVVGILIALKISNWNEGRADLIREQEHLRGLKTDFLATEARLQREIKFTAEQLRHVRAFIQLLQGEPGSVPSDQLAGMVRKSFFAGKFKPILATYTDIVNSGDLSLLRSEELRSKLAVFDAYWLKVETTLDYAVQQWSSQVTPYYIKHFNVTDMYGAHATVRMEDVDMVLPGYEMGPPIERIQPNEDAFWSREFLNLLAIRALSLGDTLQDLQPAITQTQGILTLIDESLDD